MRQEIISPDLNATTDGVIRCALETTRDPYKLCTNESKIMSLHLSQPRAMGVLSRYFQALKTPVSLWGQV